MATRSVFSFVRWLAAVVLLAVVFHRVFLRHMYYQSALADRSEVGRGWTTDGFSVGIVWPQHTDASLVQGVTLAHEEIDDGSGPLAHKIDLRIFTEVNDRGALARKVANIPEIVAVIGH